MGWITRRLSEDLKGWSFLQVHCSVSPPKLSAEMLVPALEEDLHVCVCLRQTAVLWKPGDPGTGSAHSRAAGESSPTLHVAENICCTCTNLTGWITCTNQRGG